MDYFIKKKIYNRILTSLVYSIYYDTLLKSLMNLPSF